MADINNVYTNLGEVGILPVGEWNSSTAYVYLSLVTYGGGAYLAVQNVPSGTALSNTSYWLQITEKGLKGDKGDKGDTGAKGDTGNGIASVSVEEVSVSGSEHNYRMTVTMTDGTVTTYDYTVTDGAVTSVNGRTGAVIGLAEEDGYYELMSVGSADQLISTQYIEDSVPYKFRTSGGSADIGDREIDEIVGGTLNWNQLVSLNASDWTLSRTSMVAQDNDIILTTTSAINSLKYIQRPLTKEHKYLFTGTLIPPTGDSSLNYNFGYGLYAEEGSTYQFREFYYMNTENDVVRLFNVNNDGYSFRFMFNTGTASGISATVRKGQLFDLTVMFGPEIADYIYALEQSTEGAGVAWFKKLFPNDYYAYSVPTLTHVGGLSSHDMVGFNAYDSSTGTAKVVGGQPYQITGTYTSLSLDGTAITPDANGMFTPSANRTLTVVGGNATDTCIHLVWSGTRNGEYEEYVKHSYPLDSSLTLRGIPDIDSDGNLYFNGDIYHSDGTVDRRFAEVDLSTLTWQTRGTGSVNKVMSTILPQKYITAYQNKRNWLCENYEQRGPSNASGLTASIETADVGIYSYRAMASENGTIYLVIPKDSSPTGNLVYEVATPTTETAQPYTNPQIVNDWGTEEYVSETIVPVGHNTKYVMNLRDKLQHLPSLASADGDYIIRQTNNDMALVPYADVHELPDAPTEDGTYTLKVTVSNGTASYSWEVQE